MSCWSRPPGRHELPLRTARPAGLDLRATSSMSFDWGAAEAAVTAWEPAATVDESEGARIAAVAPQ